MSGTLVSSLKAECGSHAPWHILAQVLELVASQGFTPWIGSRACALVVSSCHEVMKSSQVERKQQSSAWTKRETFLSSPMMGRRWLPGAAFGCKFGNGSVDHWTTHPNQSNIATAEIGCPNNIEKHRKTHLQSLPMCCCRSVGYFVGALVEVLCSEFFFSDVAFM